MTDSPLDDALPGRHRRIDPADYDDIYVVGDVHGCRETFEALLGELSLGPDDLLVTVGDLVRKGPDSGGVLDIVRVQENVISVRGNNEQHLVSGRKSHPDHGAEDIAFMESLPLAVSWDDTLVVHGGIDHRKPLRAHDRQDLLNMRSLAGDGYERPYWFEAREEGPRVFFGHTVLREPFESPYAVGLDTGCVYGGQLTAYDCGRDRFVSVDPPTTYRDRDEGSIVSPQRASRTA
ncbi:MAG: metallophosphoesterase family protein [Haloarculaceae archaeon]